MPNILLVGNGAREHAIAEAILRSKQNPHLFSYMKSNNPGICSLSATNVAEVPMRIVLAIFFKCSSPASTPDPSRVDR